MSDESTAVASEETPKAKKAPKPVAKKGMKGPAPKAKKAAKKEEKAPAEPRRVAGLTGTQVKVLDALKNTSQTGSQLTRSQLAEKLEITKGWAKILGAATSEEEFGEDTLEGKKMVKSITVEGTRGLHYFITEAGKKALAKAKAESK